MKQKDILLLVVPLFILIVAWIVFTIYHNLVTSTISESLSVQITPIEGRFDKGTIDSLKRREKFLPAFEATNPAQSKQATGGGVLE